MNRFICNFLVASLAVVTSLSAHGQDPCDGISVAGIYLNPFTDTTLYVLVEIEEPIFINYPGMRVYCDSLSEAPIGEVNPNTQMFGWAGEVTVEITLEAAWEEWFSLEGNNPDLRIEFWENFYSEMVCEMDDLDVNSGPNHLFHNHIESSSNCPEMLSGFMYGAATFGQVANVQLQLHEVAGGELVEPPLLDEQDAWSDVVTSIDFCLSPEGCYALVVTPIDVGPDPYWLSINGSFGWGEQWLWVSFQGLDQVVLDFNPYGGSGCELTNSIAENGQAPEVQVYPLPATDWMRIEGLEAGSEIAIFSTSGKQVHAGQVLEGSVTLDVSKWSPGVYILETRQNGHSHRQRVLIGG